MGISVLGFEVSPPIYECLVILLGFEVSPPICGCLAILLGFEVSSPLLWMYGCFPILVLHSICQIMWW